MRRLYLKRAVAVTLSVALLAGSCSIPTGVVHAAEVNETEEVTEEATESETEDVAEEAVESVTEEVAEEATESETEETTEVDIQFDTTTEQPVYELENTDEVEVEEEAADTLTGDVAINTTNFPDDVFRTYVKSFDTDGNGVLSVDECNAVKKVNLFNVSLSTLKGIEYFIQLEYLDCHDTGLKSLDVSKNVNLATLICHMNQLETLDVSKNEKLIKLMCDENQLYSLDVSQNDKLEQLDCEGNQLSSLDVSNNTNLKRLNFGQNQLTGIDVSGNKKLQWLDCTNNPIGYLDVSENVKLENLICSLNQLTSLDISQNVNLKTLSCDENQLRTLDLSQNVNLKTLYCGENQLRTLNVSQNVNLEELWCQNNQLTSLDVSQNVNLKTLYCPQNKLSSLDVSKNEKLTSLYCGNNQLTSLDVSKNIQLYQLKCDNNHLSNLDISKNVNLNLNSADGEYVRVSPQTCIYEDAANHRLDLNTVIGFDTSKVSNLNGGTISGNILSYSKHKVTYTYDCGQNKKMDVTVTFLDEKTKEFVTRLYTKCLERSADDSGVNYWAVELANNTKSGAQVAYGFIFSKEYEAQKTSDDAYIKMLYEVFMDRSADNAGMNYWKGLMQQGVSREYVFNGFATSAEFKKVCSSYGITAGNITLKQARDQNVNLTKFVNRIYVKAMGRTGEENGLNYWCTQIRNKKMTPTQVAELFINSKEFTNKNLSDEEYIKVLYRTFMGREYDQTGLNYWLGQMKGGKTRQQVLKNFAGCPEFQNIIKGFGL